MKVYVFNPEHDYALANNDAHFMALQSAIRFADDCAPFLQYIMPDDDACIYMPYRTERPFYDVKNQCFVELPSAVEEVRPWGWDKLVLRQCMEAGLPENLLMSSEKMQILRDLAHRKIAVQAMDYLRGHCAGLEVPVSAKVFTTAEEIADFISQYRDVILKSPYSGNGRGNLYVHGCYTDTLRRQTLGVIRRQGSILAEPLYDIVQDFAMEFYCEKGKVAFAGYSLFNTLHYGYAGNVLMSDAEIEAHLCHLLENEKVTQNSVFLTIKENLLTFLAEKVAPHYDGFLGVDMFLYQQDGQVKINPCVEINLRMTMGMAAHIVYEKYIHPDFKGTMQIEFVPEPGKLKQSVEARRKSNPQILKDGKWYAGYFTLNEVNEQSQYVISVLGNTILIDN